MFVVFPPVQADLLGLVDRAHDQSDADREQFHLSEGDLDVARDREPFVQHAVEDVDERADPMRVRLKVGADPIHQRGRQQSALGVGGTGRERWQPRLSESASVTAQTTNVDLTGMIVHYPLQLQISASSSRSIMDESPALATP